MPEHESDPIDDTGARPTIVAVSVGNTRATAGRFVGHDPGEARSFALDDPAAIARGIIELAAAGDERAGAIVVASVNPPASDEVIRGLRDAAAPPVYLLGRDLTIPIQGRLDPDAKTGHDRLLAALAAFHTMKQACVVVDAGTAITVDFVDGEGVFQGGAIAPGARMSLRSLAAGAHALPEIELRPPDADETFGRNTEQAMLIGAIEGARGLVRTLAERYAEAYGAYPPVIATGGDAEMLFRDDPLVDRVVPDLILRGIALAVVDALDADEADAEA